MAVERTTGGTSLIDVLDRVLDKGIVIDAWVRVSLVGIDLITVEARVVVASIDTYLKYSESMAQVSPLSRPAAVASQGAVLAENAALRAQLAATPSRSRSRSGRPARARRAPDAPAGLVVARRRCVRASGAILGASPGRTGRPPGVPARHRGPAEMANRCLEWLGAHGGMQEGHCLVVDTERTRLVHLVSHGAPSRRA